ncbi:MAG: YncE family protein [Minisyncoccia bacterium]
MNIYISNMGDDTIESINLINYKKEVCKIQPFINYTNKYRQYKSQPVFGPHRLIIDKKRKKLYSLNAYDNSLGIIDLEEFILENLVYAGNYPNSGVIFKDYILILNGDSDCISIYDIKHQNIIGQIKVGSYPQKIIYNIKYDKFAVSNMNSDTVDIIDTLGFNIIKTVTVGSKPSCIIFSQDEEYLFVVNTFLESGRNGTISIIKMKDLTLFKNIEVGKMPISIRESNGILYILNSYSNSLTKINIFNNERKEMFCCYMPSYMEILGSKGFIASSGENKLYIIDINKMELIEKLQTGKEPQGFVIDQLGP